MEKELIGKTIKKVEIKGHSTGCDSVNVLVLTMDTGEVFEITGSYGGYTGNSCGEYVETIEVERLAPTE